MSIKSIEKMDSYNATKYVNNSEPDLDAENLNKTEDKIKETVAKANEIIDTLNALISKTEQELAQLNSNFNKLHPVPHQIATEPDTSSGTKWDIYTWGSGYLRTIFANGNMVDIVVTETDISAVKYDKTTGQSNRKVLANFTE